MINYDILYFKIVMTFSFLNLLFPNYQKYFFLKYVKIAEILCVLTSNFLYI